MESFTLLENGIIHTEDLDKESAIEMKERHERFFPSHRWEIVESGKEGTTEKGMSLLDRQKRAFRK